MNAESIYMVADAVTHAFTRGARRIVGALLSVSRSEVHEQLHAVPLARRIASVIPEDSLDDGWTTSVGEDTDFTAEIDLALGLEQSLLDADIAARAAGGAWLWVVLESDDEDYTSDIGTGPHPVAAVHAVTRHEAVPLDWDRSPSSKRLGRPSMLQVTLTRDGMGSITMPVHASRLVYIPGLRALPDQDTGGQGYDLSVLDVYRQPLGMVDRIRTSATLLAERLAMPMVRMDSSAAAGSDTLGYQGRLMALANSMKTAAVILVFGKDEVSWTGPTISGFNELKGAADEAVSGEEGIPVTRLTGQAPGGLSTDDAAGARAYAQLVARHRRLVLTPALHGVYDIQYGPQDREIVWPSTEKLSDLERAQVSLVYSQRDQFAIASEVFSADEARERYRGPVETGHPTLLEAFETAPANELTMALDESA